MAVIISANDIQKGRSPSSREPRLMAVDLPSIAITLA